MNSRWFATPTTTKSGTTISNVDIQEDEGISYEDGSCDLHSFWP